MSNLLLTRRSFLVSSAIALGATALAACSPKEVEKPPEPAPTKKVVVEQPTEVPKEAKEKAKVSISHIGGTSQEASERSYKTKMFREYFAEDIEIENRWIGYGAYVEKMPLMIASGDFADIQFCNAFNDIPLMMEGKVIAQMDDLLAVNGQDILACTPEAAWQSTIYEDKQWAVCHNTYNLNVWGIQYRKDWLDTVGLTVPETIEEYAEVLYASTFKDPDKSGKDDTWGRSPLNSLKFDDDVYHAWGVGVGHHANGHWQTRDGKIQLDWVQPGMKEAVTWWAEQYKKGVIEPDGITAPIEVWGTKWRGGQLGTQYTSFGSIDGTLPALKKIDPNAAIVPGPACKGPRGENGFTGEGWPWCFVLNAKAKYPEAATRVVNWFFLPEVLGATMCQGELGITNKGLNDQGFCDEWTPAEKAEMGDAYSSKAEEVADQTYFGGLWGPVGQSLVPSVLDHMPPDMKKHFEGVRAKRYSKEALEAMELSAKYLRLTEKKRPAPSEKDYWPALQSRFLEFLSQVATGTMELEQGWTDWLAYWESNGGPTLTDEINAM